MAKKPIMKEFKKLLSEFSEKSMEVLVYAIEKLNFAKIFRNLTNIKAKLRKYLAISVLTVAGAIVFMLGLASYLKYLYPSLKNGISEMIVGAVLLIASLIIYLIRR